MIFVDIIIIIKKNKENSNIKNKNSNIDTKIKSINKINDINNNYFI